MTTPENLIEDNTDDEPIDEMQIAVEFARAFPNLHAIGGTLEAELCRTAEMLVEIAEVQGVYFAVALLHDSSYDTDRIKKLLPILQKTRGAIKPKENH